jgi:hypothetical protein
MPTTPEAFFLTEPEQRTLEASVKEMHDASAAKRLGLFFMFSRHDDESGLRWMRKAVEYGDVGAQSYFADEAKRK